MEAWSTTQAGTISDLEKSSATVRTELDEMTRIADEREARILELSTAIKDLEDASSERENAAFEAAKKEADEARQKALGKYTVLSKSK